MTNRNKTFGAKGWTPERLGSLAGKTYVITGASGGAGFEATRVFLSKGAKVVMMNRIANILSIPHGIWALVNADRQRQL